MDLYLMGVARGVGVTERVEVCAPFEGDRVAHERGVVAADVNRKTDVAEIERRGGVRMPGAHGRRGPAIGHARSELVDAVAACRVAREVDTVRVDAFED